MCFIGNPAASSLICRVLLSPVVCVPYGLRSSLLPYELFGPCICRGTQSVSGTATRPFRHMACSWYGAIFRYLAWPRASASAVGPPPSLVCGIRTDPPCVGFPGCARISPPPPRWPHCTLPPGLHVFSSQPPFRIRRRRRALSHTQPFHGTWASAMSRVSGPPFGDGLRTRTAVATTLCHLHFVSASGSYHATLTAPAETACSYWHGYFIQTPSAPAMSDGWPVTTDVFDNSGHRNRSPRTHAGWPYHRVRLVSLRSISYTPCPASHGTSWSRRCYFATSRHAHTGSSRYFPSSRARGAAHAAVF